MYPSLQKLRARINLSIIIVLSVCAAFCIETLGQSPHFRKHSLPVEFRNADVQCILQDKNYSLWFGTAVGLIRFNGISYEHFLQFPGKANKVSALFEDAQGVIWIGYENGRIGKLEHEKFLSSEDSLNVSARINGFAEDNLGRIWIATYGEGVMLSAKNEINKVFTKQQGLSDDFVYTITSDQSGRVFAGTDAGITVFSDSVPQLKIINSTNGLPDNIITSLKTDKDNRTWFGTEGKGIGQLDENLNVVYTTSQWKYGRVTDLLRMESSTWIATATEGIIADKMSDEVLLQLNTHAKELPLKITGLMEDNEGNVWVASGSTEVYSGNRTFSFLGLPESDKSQNIQAILCADNGDIWYSTNAGLFIIANNAKDSHPIKVKSDIPKHVQVISLYEDANGYIWIGTFDEGVFRMDPQTHNFIQITEKDGLINNNVLSIAGRDDEIWFATLGGVSQCSIPTENNPNNLDFTNYTSENGLGSNYIYDIFVDQQKRLWFATDGKGVTVLDGGTFKNFSLNEGLKSNIVYSVTQDTRGQVWISTSNAGIFRYNGRSFQSFSPHNGLRDLAITSIVGDKRGNLLIVSNQGVDILNPLSGAVFYHGQEFGISEIDPNLNAYDVDSAGNIWLGTKNGIILYDANASRIPDWPVIRINEVQVFLSTVDTTNHTLSHNENHVSFDYLGYWYHDPAEITYKIKLEGYDREWIQSKNHFITYPSLGPGNYQFLVQASATNHFEGAPTARYSFIITPPFYNTYWFYLLMATMFLGGVYAYIVFRERKLKARERNEKEKIEFQFETLKNQVNPHFLFNSFNTLIGVIEEDKETAIEYVEKLSDFYRDILTVREKDVITLAKELELIQNYYFLQVKRYRDNFKLKIDVKPENLEGMVPPLVLQLLVENAIKHNVISASKPLNVEVMSASDYLVVRNNLQRKIVREESTGMGLENIVNRYRLLSEKPVRIEETADYFSVYIPLLRP